MSHDEVESEWVDGWVSVLARCFGPGLQKVWPKYGLPPFSTVAAKMFLIMPMCASVCVGPFTWLDLPLGLWVLRFGLC